MELIQEMKIMYHPFKQGMSLKIQIYGLIICISILSFFVRIIIDVDTTRDYLQTQMASHAKDTATSLGLSISPYLDTDGLIIGQTMATAIFDSGYYSKIRFINTKHETLFSLENPTHVDSVPHWFTNTVKLSAPTMQSEINTGWIIAGTLEVTSHLGESYLTLWLHTKRSFYSSLILLIASLLITYFILQTIFKPLKAVEKQALLVTRKRFTLNNKVPLAHELRIVTKAINNMVLNLQSTFDSLAKQTQALTNAVYSDPLTGLGNRKSFENYFNAVTHSITSERPMTATMVTLPSLVNINRTLSYQKGDEYVTDVAKMLKLSLAELNNYRLCRINGSTFVFIAPYDITFLYNLHANLIDLFSQKQHSSHNNGYARLASINVEKSLTLSHLLSSLDTKCTIGESTIDANIDNKIVFSVEEWQKIIQSIINSGEVSFSVQPVKKSNTEFTQCYFEVFAHFIYNNEKINNSHLFAMAEKLNLTEELDKKLIRDFINIKMQYPEDKFALNISKSSLYSPEFIQWLGAFFQHYPCLKNNLIFELHELSLLSNIRVAALHIDAIKEVGISVCVEHFGTSLTSFKYLHGLDIEYVKIDGSYIQDLIDNPQSRFYIQTVNNICHGFGIKTLACLIEKPETLNILESLGCDGVQGNLICSASQVINIIDENTNKKFTFHPNVLEFCK